MYKYDNELKNVGWLLSKSDLIDKIGDDNIKFGGALIDAKNGVVTFYDVDGNKQDIFPDISSNFYLTATKYIGLSDVKKLRSLDVIRNLSVSGEATFSSSLDISGVVTTSNEFVFQQDSSEKMIIDSSGIKFMNNDPSYTALDISSTSALGLPVGTSDERPVDEKMGHIRYNTTNGQFEGYGQGVWQGLGGVIDIDQDTKITTDDSNNLIFDTSGSTQMFIDSNGDVSMANNLNVMGRLILGSSSIDVEYELDVSGDIHCTGTLFADSDIKVKKNLVPLDNALDKLSNLNGYYYHKKGEEEDSLKHIGVIAQEVEAEYPELVSSNTDIKSVNYDGINAILIECVKELRKENLEIKRELEEIKLKMDKV